MKKLSDNQVGDRLHALRAASGCRKLSLLDCAGAEGKRQGLMKQSDLYRQNAENCMQMAEAAQGEPAYNRYKRMEAALLASPRNRIGSTANDHRLIPSRR
jgi:hypothetical protein